MDKIEEILMNWRSVLNQVESGEIRAAYRDEQGVWQANIEVKEAILAAFRAGDNVNYDGNYHGFIDKHNLPPRQFKLEDQVRLVPGGSSVRYGAYIAPSVIIMPPAFVNIGAFVDKGTLIDSHVLVGSCAQIGQNVHLSAGVQIGGVLEPVEANPVVVEDQAFIGAGVILVEGVVVGQRAVIAPGVHLSASVPVYDDVQQRILAKGEAIPAGAVVVSGTRPIKSAWGKELGLNVACGIIIKYRDDQSDAALILEQVLR